jgi:Ala-tRNA(Pro) deacylase
MGATSQIHEFLQAAGVPYSLVAHREAYTAQDEAAATHVSGLNWAKVVACFVDSTAIEAVVPATHVVNLRRLLDLVGGGEIRLAGEAELPSLFPECERGAMPPFGPLYQQQVYVDVALAAEDEIIFNAGTHTEAIAMRWQISQRRFDPLSATSPNYRSTPWASFDCHSASNGPQRLERPPFELADPEENLGADVIRQGAD